MGLSDQQAIHNRPFQDEVVALHVLERTKHGVDGIDEGKFADIGV